MIWFVFVFLHRFPEPVLGLLDAFRDLREIRELQWCAILFNQFHQVDVVKLQVILVQGEFFLREIVGLVDQIEIFGVH